MCAQAEHFYGSDDLHVVDYSPALDTDRPTAFESDHAPHTREEKDHREWIVFTVRDTGIGIPATFLPHVENDPLACLGDVRHGVMQL